MQNIDSKFKNGQWRPSVNEILSFIFNDYFTAWGLPEYNIWEHINAELGFNYFLCLHSYTVMLSGSI